MSDATKKDAFAAAKTFNEYLRANIMFLKGELTEAHYHQAPVFDMNVQDLLKLHEQHNIFTYNGQSGSREVLPDGVIIEQRSWLSLICHRETLSKICTVMRSLSADYRYCWISLKESHEGNDECPRYGNIPNGLTPVSRWRQTETSPNINDTHLFGDSYYFIGSTLSPELESILLQDYYVVQLIADRWSEGDVTEALLQGLNKLT